MNVIDLDSWETGYADGELGRATHCPAGDCHPLSYSIGYSAGRKARAGVRRRASRIRYPQLSIEVRRVSSQFFTCRSENDRVSMQSILPGSAVMNLLLKPSPANLGEFYVIADDQVVGRITPYAGAAAGLPWMWVLDSSYHAGREQTHGYAATQQDALLAFANSWHREV